MICINCLSKKYDSKIVLNRLSLDIATNSIQGFVGANGAGKTTLFDCIYNLQSFEGQIVYDSSIRMGYLPTEMYFYPAMKGIEFIEFALTARNIKVDRAEIELMNVLFELPLDRYATDYSTGMKKRLVLMSILLQKNDFYLLDEPFNGLDLSSVLILKRVLIRLKERGYTVLISSHIISSLTDICDSIAWLDNGVIGKVYMPDEYGLIETDVLTMGIRTQLDLINNMDF